MCVVKINIFLLLETESLLDQIKVKKKSKAGLYLPPSVIEKQEILSGIIVEVGPGIPLGNPEENIDEPWSNNDSSAVKYIPTQADIGDMALFLNKASIEIKIENDDYLIVPQSAILILIRDDINSLAGK